MIKEIIIREDRLVSKSGGNIAGVQAENNAEVLNFTFPSEIAGLDTANLNKYIQFNLNGTTKIDLIQDNQYSLSDELTSQSEIEAQVLIKYENTLLFKSNKFTLTFNESLDNADISITFDDLDIFNTLLDKLKEDSANIIAEIESLKGDYAESNEILQNKIAEVNELSSTLELVLQNANLQISNVEKLLTETSELKEQIETALSEYDTKTDEKVSEFISTYEAKVSNLTTLATNITNNITEQAERLKTQFNDNVTVKTNEFNTNVEEQTTAFNQNVTDKQTEFDTNVENKTTNFNNTVTEQTNIFNNNATAETTEFDNNATTKLEEYNSNATAKLNEFNENAESYEKRIAELETENSELVAQMPWKTTEIQESIHVEDSAKYSKNKLDIFGNLEQETSEQSANFIKLDDLEKTLSGVTVSIKDNKIVLNGTSTSTVNQALSFYSSKKSLMNNNTIGYVTDGTFSGNGNIVIYTSGSNLPLYFGSKTGSRSYTEEVTISHMNLYFEYGSIFENYTIDFTVVEANTLAEPIPFTPAMPSIDYPSMPVVATGVQKITRCGKNLFNIQDKFKINSLYSFDDDDWVTITVDNSNNGSVSYKNLYTSASKAIKPNTTYYLVTEIKSVSGAGALWPVSVQTSPKGQFKESISYAFSSLTNNSIKIAKITSLRDLSNIEVMLRSFVGLGAGDSGSITFRLSLLEKEPTAETFIYEPYCEETFELDLGTTELCKITDTNGNVVAQDKAVYREVDGVWKWQWEKNIEKIIVNGSENWIISSNNNLDNTNYFRFDYKQNGLKQSVINCVSNNFKSYTAGTLWNQDLEGIAQSQSQIIIRIRNSIASADNLKALLAENPSTIYLTLAKPTYEDCTAEQSTVLDELYKLQLEKGVNNIFVESENGVTTELQLTYMQDLQSKLNALEAMCVSNASQEV